MDALVGATVDGALLSALHGWPGSERLPLLTADFAELVPLLDVALVLGLVTSLWQLVLTSRSWRALVDVVTTAVALAVVVRAWQVFPFDVDGTAETVLRSALPLVVLGTAVAVVVTLVRLVAALVAPAPAPPAGPAPPPQPAAPRSR